MAVCKDHGAGKPGLLTDLILQQAGPSRALDLLKFNKKRGAIMVAKVLRAAMANADVAGSRCGESVCLQVVLR